MELIINTSIPIQFEKIDEIDKRFTRVKIFIAHTGLNLNNSFFDKSVLEKMIPSLSNIPILGYIREDENNNIDFSGHEEKIVIDKDGVQIVYLGRAFGIIPETNFARFENKVCEDGVEREFLVCEGLLWNKFSNCINIFERDSKKSESMELDPNSIQGYWRNGYYYYTDARFEGVCILGENVIPAMVGASVEKFSSSNIKEQLREMLDEFNKYFSNTTQFIKKEDMGTGEKIEIDNSKDSADMTGSWGDVDKTKLRNDILKASNYKSLVKEAYLIVEDGWEDAPSQHLKYPHHAIRNGKLIVHKDGCQTALSFLNKNDAGNTKAKNHLKKHYKELGLDTSNFELDGGIGMDEKLELLKKYSITEEQLQKKGVDLENISLEDLEIKIKEFSLTAMQLATELADALGEIKVIDDWGYEIRRYWYIDHDENIVYAQDYVNNWQIFGFNYTVSGDKVTIDFNSAKRMKITYTPFEDGDASTDFTFVNKEFLNYAIKKENEKVSKEYEIKLNDINNKFAELEKKNKELADFKANKLKEEKQKNIDDLFARKEFSVLTQNDYGDLREKAIDMKLEDVEKVLYELLGKKIANKFSVSNKNDEHISLGIDNLPDNDTGKPYDYILKKYAK